jgi:hypothetical protein
MNNDAHPPPRNVWLVAAGILSFVFGPGHVVWGQTNVITKLRAANVDEALVSLVTMGWMLPAVTTVVFGVVFLALGLRWLDANARLAGWIFLAINAGRYVVLLMTAARGPSYTRPRCSVRASASSRTWAWWRWACAAKPGHAEPKA